MPYEKHTINMIELYIPNILAEAILSHCFEVSQKVLRSTRNLQKMWMIAIGSPVAFSVVR